MEPANVNPIVSVHEDNEIQTTNRLAQFLFLLSIVFPNTLTRKDDYINLLSNLH